MALVPLVLLLTNCAGGPSLNDAAPAASPASDLSGRWILSMPNAPTCGLNFSGGVSGRISPEGGCPGRFFSSRRYVFENGALVIKDDEEQPLGRLAVNAEGFDGTASSGQRISLNR